MSRRIKRPFREAAAQQAAACTSPLASTGVDLEEYCFDPRRWACTEFISFSEQVSIDMVQIMKARPDALEKKLAKMRKEWTKVKEEVRLARRRGDHLSESVEESEEMLRELERIDMLVKDLFQGQS
ncbi:hypothetical protein Taro_042030 [Colocasia esculenta]|uniref:Uncharacterized protein n=1 Tax=Colocasia esculenta TaxID=4460 RepID=A0A843WRK8_COLES|nr:hypothetical protein [Colocasia esculenta]